MQESKPSRVPRHCLFLTFDVQKIFEASVWDRNTLARGGQWFGTDPNRYKTLPSDKGSARTRENSISKNRQSIGTRSEPNRSSRHLVRSSNVGEPVIQDDLLCLQKGLTHGGSRLHYSSLALGTVPRSNCPSREENTGPPTRLDLDPLCEPKIWASPNFALHLKTTTQRNPPYEILEHTCQQDDWRLFSQDLWRILRPNGLLFGSSPIQSWLWGDPDIHASSHRKGRFFLKATVNALDDGLSTTRVVGPVKPGDVPIRSKR